MNYDYMVNMTNGKCNRSIYDIFLIMLHPKHACGGCRMERVSSLVDTNLKVDPAPMRLEG